jgi:hypothetical protein
MVNRVWTHLTALPIVSTPDDFGSRGESPTNPELLDYLADEFVRSGWSIKALIRRIVLSHTYRQSVCEAVEARSADPLNTLMSRLPIKRLSYEQIAESLGMSVANVEKRLYRARQRLLDGMGSSGPS